MSLKLKVAILAAGVFCVSHASAASFDAFYAFGDSTIDSGWWKGALNGQCGDVTPSCTTGNATKDAKIAAAIANGGTGAPVGVGLMNTQILAAYYGLTAIPANQSGGTNYAISGALSSPTPGGGNLNPSPNLPSTVGQITNYLGAHVNMADPASLYLVSSGGNDITYAQNNFIGLANREAFLATQAASLANAIHTLQLAGGSNIVVNGLSGTGTLGLFWTSTLFADLNALNVQYVGVDVAGLITDVETNPTAFGITPGFQFQGTAGDGNATTSACIAGAGASGWGQWCADTTTQDPGGQYSRLRAADSEQTSLWSDNQHLSAHGQQILADYEYGLIERAFNPTPLPAALPLFATGLGALGLLGWRRKRKAAALAA